MSPQTPLRRPGTPRTPANIIGIVQSIDFVCWVLVFRVVKLYPSQDLLRGSGVWGGRLPFVGCGGIGTPAGFGYFCRNKSAPHGVTKQNVSYQNDTL